MKRLSRVLVLLCFCLMVAACGNSKAWVKNGTEMMKGDDIRSGEFVLYGEKYSFPMPLSDFLDNGWHISNNVKNKDTFELSAGFESNEFTVFSDDHKDKYIEVKVTNLSDAPAKLAECMVTELEIYVQRNEIVFPGGMYSAHKSKDIRKAYGDPDKEEEEGSRILFTYDYESKNDWLCTILATISDINSVTPFEIVKYSLQDADENWDKIEDTSANAEGCKEYIELNMDVFYHNNTIDYVKKGYGTREDASEGHKNELTYTSQIIMYYCGINYSVIDEKTKSGFEDMAEEALKKTKWTITDVDFDQETKKGTFTITFQPSNIFEVCESGLEKAYESYENKYPNVDFDNISEEEYAEVTQYYASEVLSQMRTKRLSFKTSEEVTRTYPIDYENGIVSPEVWDDISFTLIGYPQTEE